MRQAVYITFSELFQRHPSREELVDILKKLSAITSVMFALRINNIFRFCTGRHASEMPKFQLWFAQEYLDPDTRGRLLASFGAANASSRPLCHPLQLFYLAKLASNVGRDDETARNESLDVHRSKIGTACLMINDLFSSPEERASLTTGSRDDRARELMVQMLAPGELSNPTPIRNLFIRAYVTYEICLKQPELVEHIRETCGGFDFKTSFKSSTGMPVMGWLSIIVGLFFMLKSYTLEDLISKPEAYVINRRTVLTNSLFTTEQIESFFDSLSMTFDQFKKEMASTSRPVDERLDLLPLRARPLLNFAPDAYSCFDPALLAEQLHIGPYFRVWTRLPSKQERDWAASAWGAIFESYVKWLLAGIEQRLLGKLYTDTTWEDNNEKSFDGVLVRARTVVVFEFKGGFLTQEARYSSDSKKFVDDLKLKFGKGGNQLSRDIGQLFPPGKEGRRLREVTIPPKVEFVLPNQSFEGSDLDYIQGQNFDAVSNLR
jgi:hypothetical protein